MAQPDVPVEDTLSAVLQAEAVPMPVPKVRAASALGMPRWIASTTF